MDNEGEGKGYQNKGRFLGTDIRINRNKKFLDPV